MIIRACTSRWLSIMNSPSSAPGTFLARQWPVAVASLDVVAPTHHFSSKSAAAADGNLVSSGGSIDTAVHNPQQQHQEPVRRRTRRRTLPIQEDTVPSLADFIHRAKVFKQYRSFVRLAQFVDSKDSNTSINENSNKARGCRAALDEVRISYRMSMKIGVDAMAKNMSYVEGERRLRELETTVGYHPTRQHRQSSYDADSWINIQDEDDPRGRVGVQWPWEQEKDDKTK